MKEGTSISSVNKQRSIADLSFVSRVNRHLNLLHAVQINPPNSALSATNLAIILVLLAATSAATFWFSAERYAKEQLQEIEDLRLEAEAREVCTIAIMPHDNATIMMLHAMRISAWAITARAHLLLCLHAHPWPRARVHTEPMSEVHGTTLATFAAS